MNKHEHRLKRSTFQTLMRRCAYDDESSELVTTALAKMLLLKKGLRPRIYKELDYLDTAFENKVAYLKKAHLPMLYVCAKDG